MAQKTPIKVRITDDTSVDGKHVNKGTVATYDEVTALLLLASGRAVRAKPDEKEVDGPQRDWVAEAVAQDNLLRGRQTAATAAK